ncbi:hypothetical protein ABCA12_0977 [Acinetobacter junii]|uniref:hypothetical protein n=1 Tax=Acinetobacter junii TaxID=40215 RepID=UPI0019201ACD|nr:hypothetical protein [Acinetobacter junii]QQV65641.1 hypothetical protein ABCA12_0977 [Acinetobacter junii]
MTTKCLSKFDFYFDDDYINSLFEECRELLDQINTEIAFYEDQFKEAITKLHPDDPQEEKNKLYDATVNHYNPTIEFSRYVIATQVAFIKEELNQNLIHYLGDNFEYFSTMHESLFYGDNPEKQTEEAIKNTKKMRVPYIFEKQPVIEIELTVRVLYALHILKDIEKATEAGSNTPLFKIILLMHHYQKLAPAFDDIEYYKATLATSNKHKQTINRVKNESQLKEKALQIFKDGHPTQNRKWKNRTEFKNYFLVKHNSSINDEKKWVKDATLDRWIKEFFSIEL